MLDQYLTSISDHDTLSCLFKWLSSFFSTESYSTANTFEESESVLPRLMATCLSTTGASNTSFSSLRSFLLMTFLEGA